ncbi:hypothetical protein V6N13_068507 [Hibiscus sabdariffa]
MPSSLANLVSKCTVFRDQKTHVTTLKLSVFDIPMLSCQYMQKGVLLKSPPFCFDDLVGLLKQSLSTTLSHFPPLAGRLMTDPDGHVHIDCNDAGIDFLVVKSPTLSINDILCPGDVPDCVKELFTFDRTLSYTGHFKALAAVQVTELVDGVFIGCSVNHAVTDGTSFWHFFNTFAEITKGASKISKAPDFCRETGITEISSFQSLCAQIWRSVTRARNLEPTKTTTFRMEVNCRHRLDPKLNSYYSGNAIQSIPNFAPAGELLANDMSWGANLLHKNVGRQYISALLLLESPKLQGKNHRTLEGLSANECLTGTLTKSKGQGRLEELNHELKE